MAAAFARSVNARGSRPPDATIPGDDLERRSTKPKDIKSRVRGNDYQNMGKKKNLKKVK
jgi:hypothetical protein